MINLINNTGIYQAGVDKIIKNSTGIGTEKSGANDSFKAVFDAAMGLTENANELQKASDEATIKFITGEDDSIHNVLLAQEKALIALQFTTEVTNKSLEAYNEIMRMQI